ncbi:hypothetical protein FoTM2_013616 [Fusarium oxysporum f. sp. vasinfectum]|uniref:Uncharacterized protein n=1 Tax=Fusarium oxysporum f. sp. vasinfectum 25433 TaxID=1089449 RepID=X0KGU9_FUSOX|nr:hypothetical protein FOTG_18791 [Fusarium oxysporum f. sp. vasinfectum 25433]KAK2926746.1 hypothetical protein FoTM2_013616 [Fusarium oxysporum f. sp. vasinfectum]
MKISSVVLIPTIGIALAIPPSNPPDIDHQPELGAELSHNTNLELAVGHMVHVSGQAPGAHVEARDVRRTLQVLWTITLSATQDVIMRALIELVDDRVTLVPEMRGMGVEVANIARQRDGQVAFEVNCDRRWGNCAARFVYNYITGQMVAFIREGARDSRNRELPVDNTYCLTR